jgi:hypothetical protein
MSKQNKEEVDCEHGKFMGGGNADCIWEESYGPQTYSAFG